MSFKRMGAATGFACSRGLPWRGSGISGKRMISAYPVNFHRPYRGGRMGTQFRWLRLFA